MDTYDLAVIIPTFNEEENIAAIIEAVNKVFQHNGIHGEILVVDDSSKDRTIPIVQEIADQNDNVRIIVRTEDHGLSQSVVEGFGVARSDIFQVIDADFSHPPEPSQDSTKRYVMVPISPSGAGIRRAEISNSGRSSEESYRLEPLRSGAFSFRRSPIP